MIQAPNPRLKSIQTFILRDILQKIKPSQSATAFIPGTSILNNAKRHVGKACVASFDTQDFFPSITYRQVFSVFFDIGYNSQVAHLLTRFCTLSNGSLPQGSPTSPSLSNLVACRLDKRLFTLAKSLKIEYTRYADDITFSGSFSLNFIVPIVNQIIIDEGFIPNQKK